MDDSLRAGFHAIRTEAEGRRAAEAGTTATPPSGEPSPTQTASETPQPGTPTTLSPTWDSIYAARVRDRAAFLAHEERVADARGVYLRTFPLRHRQAVGALEPAPAWADARGRLEAIVAAGGSAALLGPWGRGKTQLATAVARDFVERTCLAAEYVRFADLLGRFRARVFTEEAESEDVFLNRLGRVGLLVIDEVQDAKDSEFSAQVMTRLMDRRYSGIKPTILISNLGKAEFAAHIGRGASWRLAETGGAIEMEGTNYRAEGGTQ